MNKKKIERFKLYNMFKNNGKVCILNKYNSLGYNVSYGNLHIDRLYLQIYSDFVDSLFSNEKVKRYIDKEMHNEYCRFERCKKRLDKMFCKSDNLFFLTFTISNKYYDNYVNNYSNFERYIKNTLNGINCVDWCFNLDFGKIRDRLHAHAVVSSNELLIDLKLLRSLYKIGNVDVLKTYSDNSYAIEKYLTKFTNHSFKNTTLCRVHYKRS